MADENNNAENEIMLTSWDGKPIYAKKAERDVNGNSLELTIVGDTVTAIGGKGVAGGSDLPSGGTPGQILTKTQDGTAWNDQLSYTTTDVYDGEVHGGIVIETRENNQKVAILNDRAAYIPSFTSTVNSIEMTRRYAVGSMGTTWFPFSFKASELTNARIFKLNNITYDDVNKKYVALMEDLTELTGNDTVVACTPYIIIASNAALTFNFAGSIGIDTTEKRSYKVTIGNDAERVATFVICDDKVDQFGDVPGWEYNYYYGFSASSSGGIQEGDFVKCADDASIWIYRAYMVEPRM